MIKTLIKIFQTKELWRIRGEGALLRFYLKDYKNFRTPFYKTFLIHRRGFTVSDWNVLGMTKENYKKYLSTKEYYKGHPYNGAYSQWIDDKLTLKYLCAGTPLDVYMPEYYYQIDAKGNVLSLMDSRKNAAKASSSDIADLLEEKKVLAIKMISGSIGRGFYKGEFADGKYFLNGAVMDREGFCAEMEKLRDYIIIEFLYPHEELAKYCPDTVNTIRYAAVRVDGEMHMLKSFIRFGTKQSGFVENYNRGGVLCYVSEEGQVDGGYQMNLKTKRNAVLTNHPDSGAELKIRIPHWDEIVKAGEMFGRYFPQMQYLGFDFVVTSENKVKILEINSLTSLDSIQIDKPISETKWGKFFY